MNVAALIEKLKSMPPDAECYSFIHHDDSTLQRDGNGTFTYESLEAFRMAAVIAQVNLGVHVHPGTREVIRTVVEIGP